MTLTLNPGYGYGETMKSHEVAGLILCDCTYGPNIKTPDHAHKYAYFCIVLKGICTEFYETKSRVYKPSTFAFHPSGEVHENIFHNTGGKMFSVELAPEWVERARTYSAALDL